MSEQTSRVVFFGTPRLAVPSLLALAKHGQPALELAGVVTRPAKAVGRLQQITPSPIETAARKLGLDVATPRKLDGEFVTWLRERKPDVAVLVAYGKILPPAVLAVPPRGFVNVHPSLLPRHRGASPINAAILAGDTTTGVSIMLLDELVDHGPVLAQRKLTIPADATTGSLTPALADVGAALLLETLPRYLDGSCSPTPQEHAHATVSGLLKREMGALDWSQTAAHLTRMVRAYDPWPGTYTGLLGKRLKVLAATVGAARKPTDNSQSDVAGTVHIIGGDFTVETGAGVLVLQRVQLEGGQPVAGAAFARGHASIEGARLQPC